MSHTVLIKTRARRYLYGSMLCVAVFILHAWWGFINLAFWYGLKIDIVDIVPWEWSADVTVHPEPTIAISPSAPDTIAVSAYLIGRNPDDEESFCPPDFGGVLMSFDGGASWTLRCPLPKPADSKVLGDLSLDFTGDGKVLLASYITMHSSDVLIPRVQTIVGWAKYETTVPTERSVPSPTVKVDQPFVVASPNRVSQAFVVGSQQRLTTCGGWGLAWWWTTSGSSGPPNCVSTREGTSALAVRFALASDGRLYGLFFAVRPDETNANPGPADLVLVRGRLGENAGAVASFDDFQDDKLLDPWIGADDPCAEPDSKLGARLRNCANVPKDAWQPDGIDGCSPNMGFQVRNPNQIALAIDPAQSQTVYYAYADRTPGLAEGETSDAVDSITLRLARWSDVGGVQETKELLVVHNALNPAVAVTASGRIGLVYQQWVGDQWRTHIMVSDQNHGNWVNVPLTGPSPASEPGYNCGFSSPYLGDYIDLAVVDNTFYGTFSANNNPVRNPNARYLRDKSMLGTSVAYTIDPFFFKIETGASRPSIAMMTISRRWTSLFERLRWWMRPPPILPPVPGPRIVPG